MGTKEETTFGQDSKQQEVGRETELIRVQVGTLISCLTPTENARNLKTWDGGVGGDDEVGKRIQNQFPGILSTDLRNVLLYPGVIKQLFQFSSFASCPHLRLLARRPQRPPADVSLLSWGSPGLTLARAGGSLELLYSRSSQMGT